MNDDENSIYESSISFQYLIFSEVRPVHSELFTEGLFYFSDMISLVVQSLIPFLLELLLFMADDLSSLKDWLKLFLEQLKSFSKST